ncbi:response regulator transcription factor [Cytophagaceae bacterium ABcell3]|nr:response regulator transcription factor [Cytophagaceae bacterium ABcell3]
MKILNVEDDHRIAELIKRGLEEEGYSVSSAHDAASGWELIDSDAFDLLIIDVMLPDMSGLDLCQKIRKKHPSLPILMLTALGTTDDKVEGFDSGANDYLVKPFDIRELSVRIRELLKRSQQFVSETPKVLKFGDLEMDTESKLVSRSGKEINLTPKEFALLQYMLQNPNKVLTRPEIAENVWETHFDTGTNFIDVYINYLRKKIDKNFSQKLIHTKPGMGFILKM